MSANAPLTLGSFELQRRIAVGGVGEVWGATHVHTGMAAAVKLLNAVSASDPRALQALRAELRAIAGLDHPNIVYVFGTGEVSEETAARAGGALIAGATWIAMEFAESGTLRDRAGEMTWAAVRGAMRDVLAGLAHAHARGVVHGDVKPANLLVGGIRAGVKLGDFGLARLAAAPIDSGADRSFGGRNRWGTPCYMAPEQISAGIVGPWTDIYSVGCTAWTLITGRPPFMGDPDEVVDRQLTAPLPAFIPRCPVPDETEAWLRRMLVKDPTFRLRHAADAQRMLERLPANSSGPMPRSLALRSAPADVTLPMVAPAAPVSAGSARLPRPLAETEMRSSAAVLPETFPPRPVSGNPVPRWVAGISLDLLLLRSLAVVGREPEQDLLWGRLRDVFETEVCRAVIVRGASGVGTSRLARWISEAAAELGVARSMVAWYGNGLGPARGLRPAFARSLGLRRFDRASVQSSLNRLAPALDASDREALGAWLGTAGRLLPGGLTRMERFVLWRRVLAALVAAPPPTGEGRPIVFWIDDAHTGGVDAMAFVQSVIGEKLPVFFVITVVDELLSSQSIEATALGDLREQAGVDEVCLSPLAESASRELLERRLGLEPTFAASIAARTAGNALFMLQLLGDCVQRGFLELGRDGAQLRAGEEVSLPLDLERVWALRVEAAAHGLPSSELESMELLAALGDPPDEVEWQGACTALAVQPGWELAERLEGLGLLPRVPGGGGWRFVHAMLREALERRASRAGRLTACHRACATMLRSRSPRDHAERIGRHLRAAGDLSDCLQPLAEAIEFRILAREARPATLLLQLRQEALTGLLVAERDPRHAEQRFLAALLAQLDNDIPRADALITELLADEGIHEWPGVAAHSLWLRGRIARHRGDFAVAADCLRAALAAGIASGDARLMGRAHSDLGEALTELGDWDAAHESFGSAVLIFDELDEAMGLGEAGLGLGQLALKRGRRLDALDYLQRALSAFTLAGSRVGVARTRNLLGDVARFGGKPLIAADHYRVAIDLLDAVDPGMAVVPQINLGLLLLAEGRWEAARAQLEPCFLDSVRHPAPDVEVCARLAMLVCAISLGDAWLEASAAPTEDLLTPIRRRDPEIRALLALVGQRADAAGRADRLAWAQAALAS